MVGQIRTLEAIIIFCISPEVQCAGNSCQLELKTLTIEFKALQQNL